MHTLLGIIKGLTVLSITAWHFWIGQSDHRPASEGIALSWCHLARQRNVTQSPYLSRSLPSYWTTVLIGHTVRKKGGRT